MNVSVNVAHDISEISDMTIVTGQAPVVFIERIVVCSSAGTAIGEISEGMDMNTMASKWLQSSYCCNDISEGLRTFLLDGDDSRYSGVAWVEDTDGVAHFTVYTDH